MLSNQKQVTLLHFDSYWEIQYDSSTLLILVRIKSMHSKFEIS
jgi:hypothetical protein